MIIMTEMISTIRMVFVLASLNNLEVCGADISTAVYNEKRNKEICVITGPEFGECAGKLISNVFI